jgi:hypothetical protein
MCELCNENHGETLYCPNCGRMICFDFPGSDIDVADCAVISNGGDIICHRCAIREEEKEWEIGEEGWQDFGPSFGDDWA